MTGWIILRNLGINAAKVATIYIQTFFGGLKSMKEQNGSEKKKEAVMTKEKKFYLFSAIGCAATLVAIIVVALVVSNIGKPHD